MKRFFLSIAILAAATIAAGSVSGAEAPAAKIPGKIVLKVYPKRPVTFDHKEHARRIGDCKLCHHNPDSEKCSDCHGAKRDGSTPSFREAMHHRCKDCHMKTNKKVRGTCTECHPKLTTGAR